MTTFASAKLMLLSLRFADVGTAVFVGAAVPLVVLYQDIIVVALWALLDAAIMRLLRNSKVAHVVLWVCYGLVVAYVAINVPVARVFATPLTYSMLGATGSALGDSIRSHLSLGNVLAIIVVTAVACFGPRLLRNVISRLRLAVLLVLFIVAVLGAALAPRTETLGLHRNAWMALASTSLARVSSPVAPKQSVVAPLPALGPALDLTHLRGAATGRNVIWVILESTGALYLGSYGAKPDPTPRLTELSETALIFDNAYCAYPESIKGLHSMLCSAYSRPHRDVSEYVSQKLPCTSIPEILAKHGYRTAFFHSGQFRYLGMRGIVEGRGFHELYDAETIGGKYASSFGTDDASTAERLLAFVDSVGEEQRFFAIYSPIAGHHPYRTPGPRATPFPAQTEFDHYRNDLYTGDLALGRIIDGIKQRGLAERTIWVIVGDHGEAFEQHPGNVAHTLYVYDENLHVPFIIAAPGLTTSRIRVPQIASLIDMAPTTLELLGLNAPVRYEGRTLLEPVAGAAVSFTDHDLLKASVRHGPWKFIYESEHQRSRLFNLQRDPREQHDVGRQETVTSEAYKKWLLGWLKAKGAG